MIVKTSSIFSPLASPLGEGLVVRVELVEVDAPGAAHAAAARSSRPGAASRVAAASEPTGAGNGAASGLVAPDGESQSQWLRRQAVAED
jgi:hypothetical protein